MSRLAAFLAPHSIALVGCPSDLSRPGARPLVYLRKHGYPGQVFPVNARHVEIGGLRAYASLSEVPERPDIAWIGVPGDDVAAVLEECARLKIPNAVILTAGFGETHGRGKSRQETLRRIADEAGIAVLGPNMLGFINCWERVPLTFSPAGGLDRLIPGALGVASQSGALGGVVVNRAMDRHVGVSAMVSTGNEIGITVSECLEYFADDPRTQAVALVAEGIRDGARFRSAAARLLTAGKPLVALKVGRSAAGRRNALTHTGALAGSHDAWRAVARQLGIVEADTLDELVEIAGFLSRERRVVRRGVAVLTTSGGASIMLADHLEARGLRLPRLARATVDAVGALLPEYAVTRDNPVDVTAGLSEALFAEVLAALARDPHVDGVVATVTGARGDERARNVAHVARVVDKPVIACWLSGSLNDAGIAVLDAEGVPCFRNPRMASAALAAARDVAARAEAARRAARAARTSETRAGRLAAALTLPPDACGVVSYAEAVRLARRAGVPVVADAPVASAAEAARAARRLRFPVALKVLARDLPHRTAAGALALDLRSAAEVRRAATRVLTTARGTRVEGLLVQKMVHGVEVLVGVARDATFGPMLMIGAGGVRAELLGDMTLRPLPVSRPEILEMLDEVRSLRVLRGWRGAPAADVPALVAAIEAVVRLATALGPRLEALDVNPIVVGRRGNGAFAVDLLLELRPAAPGGAG